MKTHNILDRNSFIKVYDRLHNQLLMYSFLYVLALLDVFIAIYLVNLVYYTLEGR